MVTAIVRFPLSKDTTLDQAKALYEQSVPTFKSAPGLIRKYYLYGDQTGGGVYLWKSREAADRMYSGAWKEMMTRRFGREPEIIFYDTPVIVENAAA